jgi:hypothetical protein
VVDTLIRGISGEYSDGITSGGDAVITRTTIDGVSGLGVAALTARGALVLSNSTVSGISGERYSGGVVVSDTAYGTITNVTIAGNLSQDDSSHPNSAFAGLVVEDGAEVRLQNSLIVGNRLGDDFSGFEPRDVVGIVVSNGHNVFGQATVGGAVASDVTGAEVRDVFAALDTTGRPVVTDNGGPTPTMALLVTPDNPALEAADPAVAPELDQRGFSRVGAPDVGSFEAGDDDGGGLDGLPPLAEKVAVDPSLINGVDAGLLRGDGVTPFTITFLDAVAAQDNTIGYYVVQEDDSLDAALISQVGILFASTKDVVPGAAVQVDVPEGRPSACS